MTDRQEQQAVVRKLNLIWLGAVSSVPMIAAGLILYITVSGVDFDNELPVPMSVLWVVTTILVVVGLAGTRRLRARLLNPQRLARGPITPMAQEPEAPLGRVEARVLGVAMILVTLLELPSLVLIAAALYTTDIPLAVAAAVIHLLMLVPMKPDFAGLLRDTLNAMEADH